MADDQDFGAAAPLMDWARGAYKKANDIYSTLTGSTIEKDVQPKAAPESDYSKAQRAKDVAAATASFAKQDSTKTPTQTVAQKRISTPAGTTKITMKSTPRKR